MPLTIVYGDITKMEVDAIVNAANNSLLGGGGVDGAIHRAAGPKLLAECAKLGGCRTGEAKVTSAYNLPAKKIIHTVGPIWHGGSRGEEELLVSCYRNSLALARDNGCGSVAFPLISAGAYGYPKDEALHVASRTIRDFLLEEEDDMQVYIVVFEKRDYKIREKIFCDLKGLIDGIFRPRMKSAEVARCASITEDSCMEDRETSFTGAAAGAANATPAAFATPAAPTAPAAPADLTERMKQIDESFTEMLLRKIDESGMTDVQCYKRANIDRKLFSKIRSDRNYRPAKTTVISFAIALKLPLEETREMLGKAGFALSRSNKFDIIIEYFIENGNYDVFDINEALFAFDQPLLA